MILSIIIPVFNEKKTILTLLNKIKDINNIKKKKLLSLMIFQAMALKIF